MLKFLKRFIKKTGYRTELFNSSRFERHRRLLLSRNVVSYADIVTSQCLTSTRFSLQLFQHSLFQLLLFIIIIKLLFQHFFIACDFNRRQYRSPYRAKRMRDLLVTSYITKK